MWIQFPVITLLGIQFPSPTIPTTSKPARRALPPVQQWPKWSSKLCRWWRRRRSNRHHREGRRPRLSSMARRGAGLGDRQWRGRARTLGDLEVPWRCRWFAIPSRFGWKRRRRRRRPIIFFDETRPSWTCNVVHIRYRTSISASEANLSSSLMKQGLLELCWEFREFVGDENRIPSKVITGNRISIELNRWKSNSHPSNLREINSHR